MHEIRGADSNDKIAVPVSQNSPVTSSIWDTDGIFSRCPLEDTSDAVRGTSSMTEEPLGSEEMIRNEVTLRKSLKDFVRIRRIELIRITVRFTSEELERAQSDLEKRMLGEFATIAYKTRVLGARVEKAVGLMIIEDNQNRLRLGSRLDEILIPYRKYTELNLYVPEERGRAEGAPSWVPDWTWGGRSRDCRPDNLLRPEDPDVSIKRGPYCADRGMKFTMPVCRGSYLERQAVIFLRANPQAGIPAIVQSKSLKKTVYGDSENETSWHLGVALYAGRRRRVTHSSALLYLHRTMDEPEEQFNRLGWKYFVQEMYHYNRWLEFSESNASLVIGGRELREYCSSAKMEEDGADEQDCWTAHHAWVRTSVAGKRRLVTTRAG